MIAAREMLPDGENRFREYIETLRMNASTLRPDLNIRQYSKELSPKLFIDENRLFYTKLELAEYLETCFRESNIKREAIIVLNGLWTWLAYTWFDQLVSLQNNARAIREEAKYICSSDYRDYYRHLIAGPYGIFSVHGKENSRIFLYSPVYEHNDFIEQFASRQFIISYSNIVEAITKLYLDNRSGRPKSGAQSREKRGNIRRFVDVIQQYELTYDIYTMDADQILSLLPEEFNEWKER
ncbi:MAG: hypothetical protein NC831_08785 [Candidatus Omnitrophica bacterium]|nr:hypothetical protein [Candidatus Omnitrophota bacterium]MCM8828834.1 hypothetical protein [Candidatus Omnitrophota bacterium]